MYDVLRLSQLLEMQYTKVSQETELQFNELIIDVKMPGYTDEFITKKEAST